MNKNQGIFISELLWILLTFVIIVTMVYPIYINDVVFSHYYFLISSIILFIYFLRIIFLLKQTLIGKIIWIQIVLIFLCLPILFLLYEHLTNFQVFLDHGELNDVLVDYSFSTRKFLIKYIRQTVIIFGVGAILATIIVPFRLLLSIWKLYNKRAYL